MELSRKQRSVGRDGPRPRRREYVRGRGLPGLGIGRGRGRPRLTVFKIFIGRRDV